MSTYNFSCPESKKLLVSYFPPPTQGAIECRKYETKSSLYQSVGSDSSYVTHRTDKLQATLYVYLQHPHYLTFLHIFACGYVKRYLIIRSSNKESKLLKIPSAKDAHKTTVQILSESILTEPQLLELIHGTEVVTTSGYAKSMSGAMELCKVHKVCLIHITGLDYACIGNAIANTPDSSTRAIDDAMSVFRQLNQDLRHQHKQEMRKAVAAAKVALEEGAK